MVWPAIAAFVGSLVAGAEGQRQANNMSMDMSRENREFMEAMRRTNYQAAKWDLEQAGFNPMLSLMQGGAQSPGSPPMPKLESVGGAAVSSAAQGMQAMGLAQQIEQSAATTGQIEATTKKIVSETMEKDVNTAFRAAELKRMEAEAKEKGVSANVAFRTQHATETGRIAESVLKDLEASRAKETFAEDVARRKAESQITQFGVPAAKAESEFWEKTGEMPKYLRLLLEILRGGHSARSFMR